MNLREILNAYVNQFIEVFQENNIFEGTLRTVTDSFITIEITNSGYDNSTTLLNILLTKITYIRVLNNNL